MPSVSKIHINIHRYATKCAFELRNKEIEFIKGIDFVGNKVAKESQLFEGTSERVFYNCKKNPKDLLVHNHPGVCETEEELSIADLYTSVTGGVKKIYASNKNGFFAMDFTTAKKSITKKMMKKWLKNAMNEYDKELNKISVNRGFFDRLFKKDYKIELTFEALEKIRELDNLPAKQIRDFAKFSGATLSEVKWSDYNKVRKK